jgi:hypothetical protein
VTNSPREAEKPTSCNAITSAPSLERKALCTPLNRNAAGEAIACKGVNCPDVTPALSSRGSSIFVPAITPGGRHTYPGFQVAGPVLARSVGAPPSRMRQSHFRPVT